MDPSSNCITMVKAWEDLKDGDLRTRGTLDPYPDPVGIITIGWGHALRGEDGKYLIGPRGMVLAREMYPDGISLAQADRLLEADIGSSAAYVTPRVRRNTTQFEFDALCSFAFNVGPTRGTRDARAPFRLHNGRLAGVAAPEVPKGDTLKRLASAARSKLLASPKNLPQGFLAYSLSTKGSKKVFLFGLFLRRLAEYALYTGMDAPSAIDLARNQERVLRGR